MDAVHLSKYLIKKGADKSSCNSRAGNLIINKLLYFAQLISLSKYGDVLFENDIFAFKDGCVVEDVRQKYLNSYSDLKTESEILEFNDLSQEQQSVLEETLRLFGEFSAEELSEITHGHSSWINNYEGSYENGYYYKERQKISVESLIENEVPWIENFLDEEDDDNYELVTNNNINFYFNPEEIDKSEVIEIIKNFKGEDNVYTVVKENDGKAVIY